MTNRKYCYLFCILLHSLLLLSCRQSSRDLNDSDQETTQTARSEARQPIDLSDPAAAGIVGSRRCRDCHEHFYQLWSTSFHGLAMQPYSDAFSQSALRPQLEDVVIGDYHYRAFVGEGEGFVVEDGPNGHKQYSIQHVLGGKNVYYFLTQLERGRLQTLPVAFDVHQKTWFDTAGSAVRHFTDQADEPLHWTHRAYTFNTSCFGCHVSQLVKNYDRRKDSYHTVWKEPGINCETCHGPAEEHVRQCSESPEGTVPSDLKLKMLTTDRGYSAEEASTACAPCHAKMHPLTSAFEPGERFFDHYDLVTFESSDFYPDGRDLGENYTYTSWRMSPCVKSGELDCVHCHTSSGRFRFQDEPNQACLPCHQDHVDDAAKHSHHPADSEGSRCIACHMPMTEFARMRRSDHSMRPPMPAATMRFKSPNACNLCHQDKDAAWADPFVRQWRSRDYQAETLRLGSLVSEARKQDWRHLDAMMQYVQSEDRDEIFAASLIRLTANGPDQGRSDTLTEVLKSDASPLVRASAAEALGQLLSPQTVDALAEATEDDFRLVRIRAAVALASVPPSSLDSDQRRHWSAAADEFITAMQSRPDDNASYYNLGNFYMAGQRHKEAIEAYETAMKLRPDTIAPMVNAAIAYSVVGNAGAAERCLRLALEHEPENAAANLNLGLLLGEQRRFHDAEATLRKAFKANPQSAVAAYNLGIILAGKDIDEAIQWCRKATVIAEDDPKYAYTLAFYQAQADRIDDAIQTLQPIVDRGIPHGGTYALLGSLFEKQNKRDAARRVYERAVENNQLAPQDRYQCAARLRALETSAREDD